MIQAVAIVGPTAVGKSDVADELARRLGSEVISADAMQVYRGMDIGTGKMPPEERQAPLVLIDVVDAQESYSAALFQRDARREIDRLLGKGALPILCEVRACTSERLLTRCRFPQEMWRLLLARVIKSLLRRWGLRESTPCSLR